MNPNNNQQAMDFIMQNPNLSTPNAFRHELDKNYQFPSLDLLKEISTEVSNKDVISMHSVIASKRFQDEQKMQLPIALGRTSDNGIFLFDLAKTPHLLISGTIGKGRSIAINAIITSLLYKKRPTELKFVLVDSKMSELTPYKALSGNFLTAMPDVDKNEMILSDCNKVISTLNALVAEMEDRYKLFKEAGVRHIETYNDKLDKEQLDTEKFVADNLQHHFLPYIVVIINEYSDFIMQAGKGFETPILNIASKARAVGIHLVLATQQPSLSITIDKVAFPTQIAFKVHNREESLNILNADGAQQLIGDGDMLFAQGGDITPVQCAWIDKTEINSIVAHISEQLPTFYLLPEHTPSEQEIEPVSNDIDTTQLDPLFPDVARYVVENQDASTSRIQRFFCIGYNRAARLVEQLEHAGIIGPDRALQSREVLIKDLDTLTQRLQESEK